MNLNFIDTTIFVRFLTGDDEAKALACKALFQEVEDEKIRVTTSPLHIAEVCYVLESESIGYGFTHNRIAEGLLTILSFKNILFNEKSTCIKALEIYAQFDDLDFADAYAAATVKVNNLKNIYSYDKDFNRFNDITRLEPQSIN